MKEKIETARKCISEAYDRVYSLRVSGDDTMRVVQTLGLLKDAFAELGEIEEEKDASAEC